MKNYVIAIDAGGTYFKSAIVSEDAEILEGSTFSVPSNSDSSADSVKNAYEKTLENALDNARNNELKIVGVAIDTPGPFNYDDGYSLMEHKFKAIYKTPLRPWINAVVGDMPVTFIHDSAAFLSGEMWHCPYGDFKNAGGAMIGTGLGFATMHDGIVLRRPDGEPLYSIWDMPYGNEGKIVENWVSGKGITSRYTKAKVNAKDLEMLAKEGDKEAQQVYAETGRVLAEAAAPYLKKVEAEIFILGGQISRGLPLFEKELREGLSSVTTLKKITKSERLETSHMLGAAYDCFNKLM